MLLIVLIKFIADMNKHRTGNTKRHHFIQVRIIPTEHRKLNECNLQLKFKTTTTLKFVGI